MAFLNDDPAYHLEVDHLSMGFGGVVALQDVSLKVRQGEIYSIIGPNGAGKTTLFNCISGIYRPQSGSIRFRGRELVGVKPHKISQAGIARAFQNIALFQGMTVLENLMAARGHLQNYGLLKAAVFVGPCKKEEALSRDRVEDIIELLDLQRVRNMAVGALPYGLQKRVELGRALAMDPQIILVDEPVSGMNLEEREDMARYLLDIHESMRLTVMIIEHDMGLVMDLSDTVTVLNFGIKIAEGKPDDIYANPEVITAYLGQA
ncbi:MAG: ABC transporter ATP-binding protein [Desulfomonilaceae bacterium]